MGEQEISDFLTNLALARKYPNVAMDWGWQFVFPSIHRSIDPRSGIERRHHLHKSMLPRHIRRAVRKAVICKKVTTHTFRHSGVYPALDAGQLISWRTVTISVPSRNFSVIHPVR